MQLPAEGSESHNQHSDPGHSVPEIPLLSRVSKVNLGNPHNICYVNSSVLAFVHLTLKDSTHRALRLLRELLLRSRAKRLCWYNSSRSGPCVMDGFSQINRKTLLNLLCTCSDN